MEAAGGVGVAAFDAGEVEGPRMLVSGPPLGITGGHCDNNLLPFEFHYRAEGVADGPWAVRAKVRECVGHPAVLRQAIDVLGWGGNCVIIGVPPPTAEASFRVAALTHIDRGILGSRYGSARPHVDVPIVIDLYRQGRFKLDGDSRYWRADLDQNDFADALDRCGDVARYLFQAFRGKPPLLRRALQALACLAGRFHRPVARFPGKILKLLARPAAVGSGGDPDRDAAGPHQPGAGHGPDQHAGHR